MRASDKYVPGARISQCGCDQLSGEVVERLKAIPYFTKPKLPMGDEKVYYDIENEDTYKGLLNALAAELKAGYVFYSSKELLFMDDDGDYGLRGILQSTLKEKVIEQVVEVHANYGHKYNDLDNFGWYGIHLFSPITLNTVFW